MNSRDAPVKVGKQGKMKTYKKLPYYGKDGRKEKEEDFTSFICYTIRFLCNQYRVVFLSFFPYLNFLLCYSCLFCHLSLVG